MSRYGKLEAEVERLEAELHALRRSRAKAAEVEIKRLTRKVEGLERLVASRGKRIERQKAQIVSWRNKALAGQENP
jgi:predicted  nucleic acid-binding Zn-ribbon protein